MSPPVAIVTGGSSGIGLAVTEHLINAGYHTAIFDVDEKRGKAEAQQLDAGLGRCVFHRVDVTNYDQQAKAFKDTFEWGGNRLDVFFANAGIADTDSIYRELAPLDEGTGLPQPLNLQVFDIDVNAVIQGIHLARHFFARNSTPGGKIVITSSCLGVYSNHSVPLYSTAKHALIGLIRSSAPVYAGMGITINGLLPVLVDTNIWPEHAQHMVDPARLTPKTTVCKAFAMFLANDTMTGQTVELALDQLIFRKQEAYSNENAQWMCDSHELFETAVGPLLPNPVGQNYVKLE